jgi:MYXO-CTERM domain-containing protein
MRKTRRRFAIPLLGVAVIWANWTGTSRASLTEIASATVAGVNPASHHAVSATAMFYVDPGAPDRLVIDLFNTSNFATTHPGGGKLGGSDVLTGLAFDISGSPSYATKPTSANLSPVLTSSSTELGSGNLANTWTDLITPGGNALVTGAYGISTTGFGGAFNGKGLVGPNYGIVGPGNSRSTIAGGILPLAMNGLEFALTFKGGTDLTKAKIGGVEFLFGSEGTGVLTATPEPSTGVIAAVGALGLLGYARRRFRR